MNIYTERDSEGNRPVISEVDWNAGAFVPKSRKLKHQKTVPWKSVSGFPKYECRYRPFHVLTVRNRKTKVECVQRYWDIQRPMRGKYVTLWVDGERLRMDIEHFEQYKEKKK